MADMENRKINEEELEQVSGGAITDVLEPKYKVGERVRVRGHEEFSNLIGTIKRADFTGGLLTPWRYVVHFEKDGFISEPYVYEEDIYPA